MQMRPDGHFPFSTARGVVVRYHLDTSGSSGSRCSARTTSHIRDGDGGTSVLFLLAAEAADGSGLVAFASTVEPFKSDGIFPMAFSGTDRREVVRFLPSKAVSRGES